MPKPYFRFYWLALKEFLPERRRKLLRFIWLVVAFIVGWIVADIYGIALIRPLKWTYSLMPGSYWVAVGLLALVVFQCFVIEGARRYHQRTVRRVGFLALARGQGTQLFRDVSGNDPLRQSDLDGWRVSMSKAFYEVYGGYKKSLPLQEGWSPITSEMDIHDQRRWVHDRLTELDKLIETECEPSGVKPPFL